MRMTCFGSSGNAASGDAQIPSGHLSDHEVHDPVTRTDRKVQLLIECSDKVINHLLDEISANIAAGLPERGFTLTVKLLEPGQRPTGKKRKR